MKAITLLLTFLLVITSCSKSGIELVDKAPHVETGDRIENEQAVFMIRRIDSEADLDQMIKDLEENYSSDFNWNLFWDQMLTEGTAQKLDHKGLKKLHRLTKLSCPSQDFNSYAKMFTRKANHADIFIESLKNQNCKRSLKATTLLEIFKVSNNNFLKEIKELSLSRKVDLSTENSIYQNELSNFDASQIIFLQEIDCKKADNTFFNYLISNINQENMDSLLHSVKENPTCYSQSKDLFVEIAKKNPKSSLKLLTELVTCKERGCVENLNVQSLWQVEAQNTQELNTAKLEALLKIADFKDEKKLINEIINESLKSFENLSILKLSLKNQKSITFATFRNIQDAIKSYREELKDEDQIKSLSQINAAYILNSRHSFTSEWLLLYTNSNYSLDFQLALTQILERNPAHYIEVLDLSKEQIKNNEQAMDRLAVMVGVNLIKNEGNINRLIENYGLNGALRVIERVTELRLPYLLQQSEKRPLDFIKTLSSSLQKNYKKLATDPNITNIIQAWDDQLRFDNILKKIFNVEYSNKNFSKLKEMLLEKQAVLNSFEASFHNGIDYKDQLNNIYSNPYATILMIRDTMRTDARSEETTSFDFKHLETALEDENHYGDGAFEKLSYYLGQMYQTLDFESFKNARSEYCKILTKIQLNNGDSTFGPGCHSIKRDLKASELENSSLFSVISTDGHSISGNITNFKGGIFEVTNKTAPNQVKPNTAKKSHHAYVAPMVVKVQIPIGNKDFTFTTPDEISRDIVAGDVVFFPYFHTKLPDTPKMAEKPKEGLPSGEVNINLTRNSITLAEVLPKVIAYGSEGELPAPSVKGGNGISQPIPIEKKYYEKLGVDLSGENPTEGHFNLMNWKQADIKRFFDYTRRYYKDFEFDNTNEAENKLDIDIDWIYEDGFFASQFCFNVLKVKTGGSDHYLTKCMNKMKMSVEGQLFTQVVKGIDLINENEVATPTMTSSFRNRYITEEFTLEDALPTEVFENQGPRGQSKTIKINNKTFIGINKE